MNHFGGNFILFEHQYIAVNFLDEVRKLKRRCNQNLRDVQDDTII